MRQPGAGSQPAAPEPNKEDTSPYQFPPESLGGQPPCKPSFPSHPRFVFWGSAAFIGALIL